jgi:peroxiredoxin
LQARHEDFRAVNAEIVAISSSPWEKHAELARRIGAAFPILSDPDGAVIKGYGLLHPDALPFAEFPIARPAELILDAGGVIRKRFLTENWRVRERAEHLLEELLGI